MPARGRQQQATSRRSTRSQSRQCREAAEEQRKKLSHALEEDPDSFDAMIKLACKESMIAFADNEEFLSGTLFPALLDSDKNVVIKSSPQQPALPLILSSIAQVMKDRRPTAVLTVQEHDGLKKHLKSLAGLLGEYSYAQGTKEVQIVEGGGLMVANWQAGSKLVVDDGSKRRKWNATQEGARGREWSTVIVVVSFIVLCCGSI